MSGKNNLAASKQIVGYVDKINNWWPPQQIAADIGVPEYVKEYYKVDQVYTTLNLSFWTTNSGPVDIALLWYDALKYFGPDTFGSTTAEIQKNLIAKYHEGGVKALVSCFGGTDFPISAGVDPVTCGNEIAQFCLDNNLDGVDMDWEDSAAFENAKLNGEEWLIKCTQTIREKLPVGKYLLTHAPQAPYFMNNPTRYPNGAYLTVNKEVGDLIDWYNIQFYNQGSSTYDTYETLCVKSNGWAKGTAVQQIAGSVDLNKLVVGKPVTQKDADNTGYVPVDQLAKIIGELLSSSEWRAGMMGWQYVSDTDLKWAATFSNLFKKY